jgi:hypothetical protein
VVSDEDDSDMDRRQRRRRDRRDEEDDGDSDQEDRRQPGDEMDLDAGSNADVQMAKRLIRYAMACEYSRTSIRREGIRDKGLAASMGLFRDATRLTSSQLLGATAALLEES